MKKMKLTFVNVGYGEAILIECPDPHFADGTFVMLIDGGSADGAEFADASSGRIPLADYMAAEGIGHVDVMVSTHVHEDHVCGMLPAAKYMAAGEFWHTLPAGLEKVMHPLDEAMARNLSQEKFLRAINDHIRLLSLMREGGNQICTLCAGRSGRLCRGLSYSVLAPSAQELARLEEEFRGVFEERDAAELDCRLNTLDGRLNNYSLMLMLDYRGTKILLPGDTNRMGYVGIPADALRAHIFKVGHHGQRDGADERLLEHISPEAVVCCASSDRRYDSAHPDMMDMIRKKGAELYFSDCPKVGGLELPPHRALAFSVGENGSFEAEYVS